MRKNYYLSLLATTVVLAMSIMPSYAFSPTKFTYNSKLSNGKWVKIAIPADGIYQITAEQLAEMGFSDPNQVQIYGQGGRAITEVLKATIIDDLTAVPMTVSNGKVIFYALGPVGKSMKDATTNLPYYTRTRNAYANNGYYFITEASSPTLVNVQPTPTPGTAQVTSSYDMFLHESELLSAGLTGKQLLGESFLKDTVHIACQMPNRCDSTIMITMDVAAHATNRVFAYSSFTCRDTTIKLDLYTTENVIWPVGGTDVQRHFNQTIVTSDLKLSDIEDNGILNIWLHNSSGATVKLANLDFAAITYKHTNSYANNCSSFNMGYPMLADTVQVVMPGTDNQTLVWNVTDPMNVTQMSLSTVADELGQTVGMGFTPGQCSYPTEFVAFNPSLALNEIAGYEPIANQNLHGLSTPDMLIVTNAYFMPEAERLAQMHRDHDGMTVHVVDQEQVFNEFSSGTPDAMGIRLLCKMLYDRNSSKFKNLLMFGPASFDYRGVTSNKANRVITFVSDNSSSDEESYSSDDFFGVLADNTGNSLTTQTLNLGIGRLTPVDLTQARQNVDKIMHYVLTPDYGSWRNHYTLWADAGTAEKRDLDLHSLQAEGIDDIIQEELKLPMVADKAYVDMFPRSGNISDEARRHVIELLNAGQFYGTYIGHANTKSFTSSRMWSMTNVRSLNYDHQPIFMTACCDVARFDGNDQGIAEIMFHQPNGGAIALLTSSREVEASLNDKLNQAFTRSLFNYYSTAQMSNTLGEAYRKAKGMPQLSGDLNKMSYLLIGDPAMKVYYPKPLFNITSVNGVDMTGDSTVDLAPMQLVTIEAEVMQEGSTQVNQAFNGDATLSIYDVKQLYKHATYTRTTPALENDLFYPRDLLVEVQGRVTNGHFSGTAVMPRYFKAKAGEQLAIHVYAHQDNSTEMVNGATTQVVASTYDAATAIQDDAAPIIEAMYLNEKEAFEKGAAVAANSTLHVTATDDVAFNNQIMGVGSSAKLVLDGGKTNYALIRNYLNIADGGKSLQVHFPLTGLTPGRHSLTMTVVDVAGNQAERTISFMVAGQSNVSLKTDDLVAIEQATIDMDETDMPATPTLTLKVVDNKGQLVWRTTTNSLPCTWDLTDAKGQRVTPGLYKLFGQYNDGANYGGTNILPVIVMDPVKQAQH